jgi:L-lactate permease
MEVYAILGSFLALLIGALHFKKLWLGAMMALLIFVALQTAVSVEFSTFVYPLLNGGIISAELTLLLFGAYLFYTLLQSNRHFETLNQITSSFSSKRSVILILCYFLGSFMEGVAGFGIPAMLIAPMLVALGYKPLTCIVLPLAANTTAVTFGALGTPLKIGLGIFEPNTATHYTLLLNLIPALLLPFFLGYLYSKTEGIKPSKHEPPKMLWGAGIIYSILYALAGLVTIEYVAVLAGIGGLFIYVFFFVPKNENPPLRTWLNTFYPYFVFILLLFVSKYFLSDRDWILSPRIKPISFYQPGAIFIVSGLLYHLFVVRKGSSTYVSQCRSTIRVIIRPVLTILLLVCYAQVIRADIATLAQAHLHHFSEATLSLLSPLLGISGSFLSGSATMSNLIFGSSFQSLPFPSAYLPLLVALLHTGSAIGNAISLQNILMVKSVVNEPSISYSTLLKLNVLLVGAYLLLVVTMSRVLAYYIGSGGA